MPQTAIFWPMIAQTALIYGVYLLISLRRRQAIQAGSVRASEFRENRNEPPESLYVRNNLANQFELPVLFYAVGLALFAVDAVGTLALTLAWLFVISRYVHAAIHVTTNRLRYRSPVFAVGYLVLGALWALLALHLLGA